MSWLTDGATLEIKLACRGLYIDSGLLENFELTPIEVERLKSAGDWINRLLEEQAERERGRNAA